MLSIKEFIQDNNYNIDLLHIDKLWCAISDDAWVYIDDKMLEYIGYDYIRMRSNKEKYIEMLKTNFNENIDYKQLNASEFKVFYVHQSMDIEQPNINIHNRVKHLLLTPDCFKESLMLLKTEKAKSIRKYYITLEKVFKHYIKYQKQLLEDEKKQIECEKLKLTEENKKLKDTQVLLKEIRINKQPMIFNYFIYIASNRYYRKKHLFKIGKAVNPIKRIENFNCTSKDKSNEFFLIYQHKTTNGKLLEEYLFHILQNFHYKGELYQIPEKALIELVDFICLNDNENNNLVGNC